MARKATGSVYYSNSKWYARTRVKAPDGTVKRVVILLPGATDEFSAKQAAMGIQEDAKEAPDSYRGSAGITFAELVERYKKTDRWLPGTEKRLPQRLLEKQVKLITPEHLMRVVDELDEIKDVAWQTRRILWFFIRSVLQYGRTIGLYKISPAAGVDPPRRGGKKALSQIRTAEINKLIECESISIHRREMWAFLALTGLRVGEAMAIRRRDINLEENYITITRSIGRDGKYKFPKSGETREIIILPELKPLLEIICSRSEIFYTNPNKYSAETFRKDLERSGIYVAEGDGQSKAVRVHDLRAYHATTHLMRGTPIHVAQKYLGHSSIEQTSGYLRSPRPGEQTPDWIGLTGNFLNAVRANNSSKINDLRVTTIKSCGLVLTGKNGCKTRVSMDLPLPMDVLFGRINERSD